MTDRQREILEYMEYCLTEENRIPTIRDIATEFRIKSPNGVMCHLIALKKKGHLLPAKDGRGHWTLNPERYAVSISPVALTGRSKPG